MRLTEYQPTEGGIPLVIVKDEQNALQKLAAYEGAEEQGRLVRHDESMALAMLAGARAIEQNPRKYFGTTFVHEPFGNSKEITYYEAAIKLRTEAEAALKGEREDV